MSKIEKMSVATGRVRKENDEVINTADILSAVYDAVNGVLKTSANINVGDIEIGAVELKDAETGNRAAIGSDGALKTKMVIDSSAISKLNQIPTNITEEEISIEITRPSDTVAYTANDLINANAATTLPEIDFSTKFGASVANRRIQINSIQITSSNGSASTKLIPEVIFYNANTLTGSTLIDNIAFNPTYAQHVLKKATAFSKQENWVTSDFAYGNFYEMRLTEIIRNACLDVNGKLFLALIATNAYIPASSEKLTITIKFYLLN